MAFRWGGIPNRAQNENLTTSLGMMATENGTAVQVFSYDTGCKFRKGNARGGITADTQTITLYNGQTIVLKIATTVTTNNLKLNTSEVIKTKQIDIDSNPNNGN